MTRDKTRDSTLVQTIHRLLHNLAALLYIRCDSLVHVLKLEQWGVLYVGHSVRKDGHRIFPENISGRHASGEGVVHVSLHPHRGLIWAVSTQFERPWPRYPEEPLHSPSLA